MLFPGDGTHVDTLGAQGGTSDDEDMRRVLALSERETSMKREQEEIEDEELQMILKLSLTEK